MTISTDHDPALCPRGSLRSLRCLRPRLRQGEGQGAGGDRGPHLRPPTRDRLRVIGVN